MVIAIESGAAGRLGSGLYLALLTSFDAGSPGICLTGGLESSLASWWSLQQSFGLSARQRGIAMLSALLGTTFPAPAGYGGMQRFIWHSFVF